MELTGSGRDGSSDGGCSREEGEVTAGCHGGGGGPSRPPWTGGRSGQGSSRLEQEALWEHGRLRRGRREELEGRGVCLGGCCAWCDSFQANRVPFYRRERAGAEVARRWPVRRPATCDGSRPGAAALGSLLACTAEYCGRVMRVLACWSVQR
jgi:hypothetical protein